MARLFHLSLLALLATPALAQNSAAHCAGLGATAAKVMEARQLGIAQAELLALIHDGAATQTLTWIVEQAYEEPFYGAEWQQQAAVAEFARAVEAACLAG
ncbi:MAG TPA: hypothetical protein VM899_12330 [Rubellimicrobium sp.]|nr:hypothetical protein [Rubellimicrobium sp.]